ncbi:MAG: hypothetical protein HC796_11315 [Synechococcaceae cyanobacterium RL_1_2]|nr:hypothetical protein [Synechococcaceae cyanobacterium RL_1_2]
MHQQSKSMGLELADDSSELVWIMREANSIVAGNIGGRYLYANVYRYWNYASQLQEFASSQKPLIIYDLDCFTPAQITPLTFENRPDAPYPIPIIDTRSLKEYDELKLAQSHEKIYDSICQQIADYIVIDLGLDLQNTKEVATYLQKINFLNNCDFRSSNSVTLILEINNRYYLADLSQEIVTKVIWDNLPVAELKQIIANNPDFNFVLLSSFTKLPAVKQKLKREFSNSLFIPNIETNDFSSIWEKKLGIKFPLFGQHLDDISFFVRSAGQDLEISLPSQICYEGQQEAIVYGKYARKGGELEQHFPLKTPDVTLPFKINKEPFIDAQTDKEQAYKIENQYFADTPELSIKIRFRIKPGLTPKLEVLDENERILHSTLIDHEHIEVSTTLGFIPMSEIREFRTQKSKKNIQILSESNFYRDFESFCQFLYTHWKTSLDRDITNRISDFRSTSKPILLPILNNCYLPQIYQNYSLLERVLENLLNYRLTPQKSTSPDRKQAMNKAHKNLLLILGDSYALTSRINNLDFLFDQNLLTRSRVLNWDERLRTAAKVSCSIQRQDLYLKLFNEYTMYRNKKFYKTDVYMWGYARLLLWYVDINNTSLLEIYKQHFDIIVSHCLSLNANIPSEKSYIRDALIALIYMLTFREISPQFVEKDSSAYNQAQKLCDSLQTTPILSRKANIEDPLNQLFEQLLDGSATQEQVRNMIEID